MLIRIALTAIIILVLVIWFKQAPKRSDLENGTRIILKSGKSMLNATLNNSVASRSLIAMLPMDISFGRSSVDFCATAPNLEQNSKERQFGWHDGDISLVGGWLSIFYGGQHRLPMPMMVLGSIDEADITKLKELGGSVRFRIEIAEQQK